GKFSKITFEQGLLLINEDPKQQSDFTLTQGKSLSEKFDRPFWIHKYPPGVRDSIFHQEEDNTYSTFDLMLPFGYGELITGGIRAKSGEAILEESSRLDSSSKTHTQRYAKWK